MAEEGSEQDAIDLADKWKGLRVTEDEEDDVTVRRHWDDPFLAHRVREETIGAAAVPLEGGGAAIALRSSPHDAGFRRSGRRSTSADRTGGAASAVGMSSGVGDGNARRDAADCGGGSGGGGGDSGDGGGGDGGGGDTEEAAGQRATTLVLPVNAGILISPSGLCDAVFAAEATGTERVLLAFCDGPSIVFYKASSGLPAADSRPTGRPPSVRRHAEKPCFKDFLFSP
ncbi:unnamed protein product [Phaeothamnion confervicola]